MQPTRRPDPAGVAMWPAVALGAMVGASLRYGTSRWLAGNGDIHWATLLVNVVGSFVLGVVTALASSARLRQRTNALVGTGMCGALTTFSTFAVELVVRPSAPYLLVSLAAGLAAARLGLRAGRAVVR